MKHSHPVELKALPRAWFRGIIETAATDVGGLDEVLKNGTGKVGPRRIPAYWYSGTKAGKTDELAPLTNTDDDLVVLYFHGGAYIIGSAHEQDSASAICRDFVDKTPARRVLSVDYRLAGLAPFPAARKACRRPLRSLRHSALTYAWSHPQSLTHSRDTTT